MQTIIRIRVSYADQLPLMEELNSHFPQGTHKIRDGRITAFIIEDDKSSPEMQNIINYIEKKGLELTHSVRNYSKHVSAKQKVLYDKNDLENAEYLHINCKKDDGARSGRGNIIDGRAQIEYPPHKFRYCISQTVFLISSAVKQKLEAEKFLGPIFLPVDLAGDESTNSKPLEDLFALYSSIELPKSAGRNEFLEDTYDRGKLVPFDLAITHEAFNFTETVHHLICSQKFYRFWEANLGDAEYRPVRVREEGSPPPIYPVTI